MRWIVAVVIILLPVTAQAAITCTGQSFPFDVPTDPQAQDYTVPTVTNGITILHTAMRASARALDTLTIGGDSVTEIDTKITSTNTSTQVSYRLSVGSGTQSVSANFDAAPLTYVLTAVTCEGVDQTTPVASTNTASGSSTTASVTCTGTTAGQVVLDFVSTGGGTGSFTAGGGQTNIDNDTAESLVAGASIEAGGGDITMSQTVPSGDWVTRCVVLNPASNRIRGGSSYLP